MLILWMFGVELERVWRTPFFVKYYFVTGVGAGLLSIAASLAATLVWSTGKVSLYKMGAIYGPIGNDWWRLVAAPFLHDNAGYQFICLLAAGIFGTALERRFGWYAPLFIFLLAGTAGCALAVAAKTYPVWGANGAALGLLSAWFVEYRMTREGKRFEPLLRELVRCAQP